MTIVILSTQKFYMRQCSDCMLIYYTESLDKTDKCPKCGNVKVYHGEDSWIQT